MSVVTLVQTRTITALDMSTATAEDMLTFLAGTGYTWSNAPFAPFASTPGNLGVIHRLGFGPASPGRFYFQPDQYLVKIGDKMQQPVNAEQFAVRYASN